MQRRHLQCVPLSAVLVIDVTISEYIKPPINMTLNVIVDLVLHRRLGIYHEALVQPIAKMSKQGVVGPYTHVGLNEVVNWSGEVAVDSPPMFTVDMAPPKLVYYRVLMAATMFDNFVLNVCEFMGPEPIPGAQRSGLTLPVP
jgi:hypothetical protein